ncbi:hypothetical protein GJA_1639 [Janthinobacterium agaricidamnosum NBRC 102515 = DSM 9628]|uniref:Uncharacterized protein n=1 Tax=Janthinobacterium agaricidamnosum NBRC 102515 = DSM 9628 TaxID=1349767 RepID=W0V0C1_9BURK|nr:hypothetical protein GJA_1639 [Janthinobacterium agaricidamnosum NBRC 102515 = DSM 9628]
MYCAGQAQHGDGNGCRALTQTQSRTWLPAFQTCHLLILFLARGRLRYRS